jgi:hypothetical protein
MNIFKRINNAKSTTWKALYGVVILGVLTAGMANVAAADATISISLDTVLYPDEGSLTYLGEADTSALNGRLCVVVSSAVNPDSLHPDNDLVFTSATVVKSPDVEGTQGVSVHRTAEKILLNDLLVVELRAGPDETWSAGFDVTLDCDPVVTTTTSTTTTTTEPPSTTTSTVPTTTEPEIPATTTTTIPLPSCLAPGESDPRGPQDFSDGNIPETRQPIPRCGDPEFTG